MRANLILRSLQDYDPHVLLVDHAPTGMRGEMLPALEWLAKQRPDCIKLLGAFIGPDELCRERLIAHHGKQEAFFRRIDLLDADVAVTLLGACGIPRCNYICRTHAPEVAPEVALNSAGRWR